jgi:CMP/dCMP kinase
VTTESERGPVDATRPAQPPLTRMVVALDGPSGSGKSSVARGVASRLGLRYLDTGAMYRAMTWWMLQQGVDVSDAAAVAALVDEPRLTCGTDPGKPTIAVDGFDVSEQIRSREVTGAVSAVSAVPELRARLVAEQRQAVGEGGIVVEGRDIGTVVTPDAPVKVFLTACPSARAERRSAEQPGGRRDVGRTQAELARRDHLDSTRVASPLVQAPDAEELDTTYLTLDEVVERVTALVRGRAELSRDAR